ncbi:unnamed protein product [Prunus armeniaca]
MEKINLDIHSPPISKIEVVTSASHQKIRYPIPEGGVGQINSDQAMVMRCTTQGLKKNKQLQFIPMMQAANEADRALNGQANLKGKGVATFQ